MVARLDPIRCCTLLVLGFGVSAPAQVRQVETGRSLDSNFGRYSGGRNQPVPRFTPNRSGLTISGNVTGGRSFRGFAPVQDPSQLRTGLPSSSLSSFLRDSVSVGDVAAGRTQYQPQPYFSPERTVTNLGAIRAGLNRPGSSMPRSAYALPRGGIQPSRSGLLDMTKFRTPDRAEPALTGGSYARREYGSRPPASTGYDQAAGSGLAGGDAHWLGAGEGARLLPPPPPVPPADLPGETEARTTESAGRQSLRFADPLENPLHRSRNAGEGGSVSRLLRSQPFGRPTDWQAAPKSFDRRENLDETRREDRGLPGAVPPRAAGVRSRALPLSNAGAAPGDMRATPTVIPITQSEEPQPGTDAHWRQRAFLGRPIRSFVNLGTPSADKYLARAEAFLREGKYYRAAGQYEIARELDRTNPLPLLGKGQALIGAGDFFTAAHMLQRGLAMLADAARFQLELPALMSQKQILERRRGNIEKRLAGTLRDADRYRLAFVLGYIEFYSGQAEAGMKHLEAAAALAPEASVIHTFPERLRETATPPPPPPAP